MEIKLLRFKHGLACPYCGGHQIVLWGKRKNIQRYRCKSCAKLFNDLTGTPLACSKLPEKWSRMAVALQQSMTVRETAQYLGVCNDTAFRWRHRMLAGVRDARLEVKLAGIVELDETFFRYSEKGARKLQRRPRKRGNDNHLRGRSKAQVYAVVARDRTSRTRSFLLRHMSGKELLSEAKNVIAEGSVLCSDCWRSYKTFALKAGHRHISLNLNKGKRVVHGIYHIQSVNSYHSRLKTWVRRFNGVATKYLLNYLIWHEHLDETRKFQRGMGEQKLFITAVSTARLVAAA